MTRRGRRRGAGDKEQYRRKSVWRGERRSRKKEGGRKGMRGKEREEGGVRGGAGLLSAAEL